MATSLSRSLYFVESTAIGAEETREIEVGDIVEILYPEGPERYQISEISVHTPVGERDLYDMTIYLRSYMIDHGHQDDPEVKHLFRTNTWEILGHPDVEFNSHPKPLIPRSTDATNYLRKSAGYDIFRHAFEEQGNALDEYALPYSGGTDGDIISMIESATEYWELLLFDQWIQEMVGQSREDLAERRAINPENLRLLNMIFVSITGDDNYVLEVLLDGIVKIREEYLELLSPDIKPAGRR